MCSRPKGAVAMSEGLTDGTDQTPIWNFITTQVWAVVIAIGLVASVITRSFVPVAFAPWIGLLLGVVANELLSGFVNEGVRIV